MYTGHNKQAFFLGTTETTPPNPSPEEKSLTYYLNQIPTFPELLKKFQAQGLFLDIEPVDYCMDDFLIAYFGTIPEALKLLPSELLIKPLKEGPVSLKSLTDPKVCNLDLPKEIWDKIDAYIDKDCEALDSHLGQRIYEKKSDQEKVTEREHASEAGKLAYQLGMKLGDIIALEAHDIARVTEPDPSYCHVHHAKEGGIILEPLYLSPPPLKFEPIYSTLHTLAKLGLTFCPAYLNLISEASINSLALQSQDWSTEIEILKPYKGKEFATILYKNIFMRLIDDLSKVPTAELQKKLGGQDPEYFDQPTFKEMMKQQMITNLNYVAEQGISLTKIVDYLKASFDKAFHLLNRVDYSTELEQTIGGTILS